MGLFSIFLVGADAIAARRVKRRQFATHLPHP
jgi:hypothetical protein